MRAGVRRGVSIEAAAVSLLLSGCLDFDTQPATPGDATPEIATEAGEGASVPDQPAPPDGPPTAPGYALTGFQTITHPAPLHVGSYGSSPQHVRVAADLLALRSLAQSSIR
jgi:hypothetical protein